MKKAVNEIFSKTVSPEFPKLNLEFPRRGNLPREVKHTPPPPSSSSGKLGFNSPLKISNYESPFYPSPIALNYM